MPFHWNNTHADRGRYDKTSLRPASRYFAQVLASFGLSLSNRLRQLRNHLCQRRRPYPYAVSPARRDGARRSGTAARWVALSASCSPACAADPAGAATDLRTISSGAR